MTERKSPIDMTREEREQVRGLMDFNIYCLPEAIFNVTCQLVVDEKDQLSAKDFHIAFEAMKVTFQEKLQKSGVMPFSERQLLRKKIREGHLPTEEEKIFLATKPENPWEY